MENTRKPGEEITPKEYEEETAKAMEAGTLRGLSLCGARYALEELGRPIHDGYMVEGSGGRFIGYGWTNYQRGTKPEYHYYYLGEVEDDPKLNGVFYYFDCMNAFTNSGYFPAENFTDEETAIKTGADYEADVHKVTFKDGEAIEDILLYTPYEGRIIAKKQGH